MLADIGDDDGFTVCLFPDIVDDVRGVEVAVVRQALNVTHCRIAFEFRNMANPCAAIAGLEMRRQSFKNLTGIADKCCVNLHVFVDFGAVDLNVDFAGALGVSAQVAGDAVVKPHAHAMRRSAS